MLENLLGGGQQQQDYQNFVNRYHQGPPSEGYSDQEVLDRYNQIAPNLPPQQYHQAAQAAFANMPPDHREQLGQFLSQAGQQFGLPIGGGNYQDPNYLAQMATQMHQQQPGILGQLLGGVLGGGGSGGGMGGGMLGGALGGMLGGGSGGMTGGSAGMGGLLSNPVAKSALAGIAAMAVKQFMSQRH